MNRRMAIAIVKEHTRKECENSLYSFIREGWHTLHPGEEFQGGWAIKTMCRHLEAVTAGEVKRLLINVPPGCTKALDVDTPVLTTWGWKRHGDLAPGDYVFGPDGLPKKVLAVTHHMLTPCHEVKFKGGSSLVASEGHQWLVGKRTVLTTLDLTREHYIEPPMPINGGGVATSTVRRYVSEVSPVGERVANCIQVEGELYLAGRDLIPTHNSMLVNVFWPAWEWGPKGLSWYKYISTAHEKGLVIDLMAKSRELLKSEWYQSHWPVDFKGDADGKEYYATVKQGSRFAGSVTSKLTGRRGNRFIIDDPHSVASAESDVERATAGFWFTETTPTRFTNQKDPVYVIIMQRLHMQDISGIVIQDLIPQGQEWTHLCLPMEFEEKHRSWSNVPSSHGEPKRMRRVLEEGEPIPYYVEDPEGELLWPQDPRTEEGELLWPERFDQKAIDDLKIQFRSTGGSYAEASQLQQRPVPRGGGMFSREWFKFVDSPPSSDITWVRGYDLAATEDNPQAAWTVGCKLGLGGDGRLYIADIDRAQAGSADVERMILAAATRDGYDCAISIPQDPGQAGKAQVNALASLLHGYNARFTPESGSKENRAIPIAAQAEVGNLYLVRAPWNDTFIAEASMFPASKWADQVDALSRAYAYLIQNRGNGIALTPGRVKHYR